MNVLNFEPRRKQVQVKVHYAPWRGSDQVPSVFAWALVILRYEINGHQVSPEVVTLEAGFMLTLRLETPEDHPEIDEDMNEKNRVFYEESIAAIRDEFTAHDWLEGTTDEVLVLPIARLEMVERSFAGWKVMRERS